MSVRWPFSGGESDASGASAGPEAPAIEPEVETAEPGLETEIDTATEEDVRLAPRWKVILHDDDVTTFDFVIWLLITLFHKGPEEAVRITFEVHETGSAPVVVAPRERAELYVEQVRAMARPRGFPLVATMEPE